MVESANTILAIPGRGTRLASWSAMMFDPVRICEILNEERVDDVIVGGRYKRSTRETLRGSK